MIDLRYVKKLIEMIDESSVDSIEISTEKGIKIRIAKSPVTRGGMSVAAPVQMAAPAQLAPVMDMRVTPSTGMPVQGADGALADRAGAERPASSNLEVKSPMV